MQQTVKTRPLVAVTADRRAFDAYHWHAVVEQYIAALARVAVCTPLVVPALGSDIDMDAVLDGVDGVMATGSRSNVHPARYGGKGTRGHEPYDTARDATSLGLIEAALARGVPLLAVCRGMQELNVVLGGTLATEIQERPDGMDHRAPSEGALDERFALSHEVRPQAEGKLAALLGEAPFPVNSLHRQGIERLAPGLAVEALAPDGTIEAVSLPSARAFVLGVQWHPEYWAESDTPSRLIFEAFGEAVRAHRLSRPAP